VLARSSQPSIGFFGMTNEHDVKLYDKIRIATGMEACVARLNKIEY